MLRSSVACLRPFLSRQNAASSTFDPRQEAMTSYLNTVTIQDLINDRGRRVVLTIPSNSSVTEAVLLMNQTNVGAVMVSDQKEPVGIFTEKDFLTKIAAKNKDPADVAIEDVMTTDIFTASPTMSMFDAMSMMGDHGIRHLPIAAFVGNPDDNDTRIVDIVSARDFFSWFKNC
mmetsp:Transcript_17023/g.26573  ORF Transcript_17023/g.26573 Transcript_17023/m.26573 type:complete len:173 (-) Transcript_17023:22-540(-)